MQKSFEQNRNEIQGIDLRPTSVDWEDIIRRNDDNSRPSIYKSNPAISGDRLYSLVEKHSYTALYVKLKQGALRANLPLSIYDALSHHPEFEDDFNLSDDATEDDIAAALNKKIIDLAPKDHELEFVAHQSINHNNLVIAYYKDLDVCQQQNSICLKWITALKDENERMYNVLIAMMGLMMKEFGILNWKEGWDEYAIDPYSEQLFYHEEYNDLEDGTKEDFLEHCSKEEIEHIASWIDNFDKFEVEEKDGAAVVFLKEIESKEWDVKDLKFALRKFKAFSRFDKIIRKWAYQTLRLVVNYKGFSINQLDYITEEEYEQGQHLMPSDYYKFYWNFHSSFFESGVEMWINDIANNVGVSPPRSCMILKSTEAIHYHPANKLEQFGKALQQWFEMGQKLYWNYELFKRCVRTGTSDRCQ